MCNEEYLTADIKFAGELTEINITAISILQYRDVACLCVEIMAMGICVGCRFTHCEHTSCRVVGSTDVGFLKAR